MDLSVITVTYQSREHIDGCILSVISHLKNCRYEHIVVDNGSDDGTVEIVKQYSAYVQLVENGENRGFAAGNNRGVKEAKGRYLLFLNPDMALHDGDMREMVEWMDQRKEAGLASCKLLSCLYEPHPVLRPFKIPRLGMYLPMLLGLSPFFCSVHQKLLYENFQDEVEQEVEAVRGAFMLVRKEVIEKLGWAFYPGYFVLLEDVDLCRAVKRLGYAIYYVPKVSCVDYFGKSFAVQSKGWKYKQMARSLKVYAKRWHSPWHLVWLNVAIPLGFFLRWGISHRRSSLSSSTSTPQ